VPAGYFPVRPQTLGEFWLMRTSATSESHVTNAVTLIKKIRMYPLAQVADPPEQRFIDATGKLWTAIRAWMGASMPSSPR
jgi:hypothetical protein